MPKVYTERSRSEIANKTKNGPYYKCLPVKILNDKICSGTACLPAEASAKEGGDEIFWNTDRKMIECKCKKMWVDGCEDYVQIGGGESDHKVIHK